MRKPSPAPSASPATRLAQRVPGADPEVAAARWLKASIIWLGRGNWNVLMLSSAWMTWNCQSSEHGDEDQHGRQRGLP